MRRFNRNGSHSPVPCLLLLLASCGAGTFGIAVGSDSGGGSGTPTLTTFEVREPKLSPVTLRLEASRAATAELFFALGGGALQPMAALSGPGVAGNRVELPAGVLELAWDFAVELGGTGFEPAVELAVQHPDGRPISGGSLVIGMGNDPPVVTSVLPIPTDPADPDESSGIVEVSITASDSSGDVVGLFVEWRRADDPPDQWMPATAAGMFPQGIKTPDDGGEVSVSFFWNTNIDLADAEDEVVLRATATDPVVAGEPVESTGLFRIDNNEEPILQFDDGFFLLDPDEVRGIPLAYNVIDEEQDPVRVVFQWRREGETYPPLPSDVDALEALMADPVQRRELQICSSYPRYARGHVVPVPGDPSRVRLPELGSTESWILATGAEGLRLQLLRPSNVPEPLAAGWSSNPLDTPVAALPQNEGRTALVLEAAGGGWRLRELELATGNVERELATGAGQPTAMTLERDGTGVLVALDLGGAWVVDRVELATGARTAWLEPPAGSPTGPLRAIVSLGTNAALATAGDALLRLDVADVAPRVSAVVDGLHIPWGIVLDPRRTNRVYLAERDAPVAGGMGRVVSIDVQTRTLEPVPPTSSTRLPRALPIEGNSNDEGVPARLTMGTAVFPSPTALALEDRGTRLLVLCDGDASGPRSLRGLQLGGRAGTESFLVTELPPDAEGLATGPAETRLLPLPASSDIATGGGVSQERSIDSFDPRSSEVELDLPFTTAPGAPQPWRIPVRDPFAEPVRGAPSGRRSAFVWDGRETQRGGHFLVRAVPLDDELGTGSENPRAVVSALERASFTSLDLPPGTDPRAVAAADLDGDGDVDLATANHGTDDLTVLLQTSPGIFDPLPTTLGGPSVMDRPDSLIAADLDGDGDMDLASANLGSDDLTLFLQTSSSAFDPVPIVLGGSSVTNNPESLAVADVDGDGDVDLVSANRFTLTVFPQTDPGVFDPVPIVVQAPSFTDHECVVAADVDGDGDVDLASANSAPTNNLTVYLQTSPGSFDPDPIVLGGTPITRDPRSLVAADVDGDGAVDLTSANYLSQDLTVFLQRSSGEFEPLPIVLGGLALTGAPLSLVVADVDGDGDQDLASANPASDSLAVFLQIGTGVFDRVPIAIGGTPDVDSPVSLVAVDVDGDGDLDLTSANEDSDNLTVFSPSSFAGSAFIPEEVAEPSPLFVPSSPVAADIDGDGDLDLASANRVGDDLKVFLQTSPASFDPIPIVVGGSFAMEGPESLAVADLNGDGALDLASANVEGNDLTVFLQASPGIFAQDPIVVGGPSFLDGPFSLVASDLNRDGYLDLASANILGHDLTVFLQLPSGSFDPVPIVVGGATVLNAPRSLIAADVDADGYLDLASANIGNDDLTVFLQLPSGGFEPDPIVVGGPLAPTSLIAADVDADGYLDLASANRVGDDLKVFLQTSPASFDPNPIVLSRPSVQDIPMSVVAIDVDGDHDLDLVSANAQSADLTVFLQTSPGVFDPVPMVVGGPSILNQPRWAIGADVDGDGDADLVSAGPSSDLTVFWGGR